MEFGKQVGLEFPTEYESQMKLPQNGIYNRTKKKRGLFKLKFIILYVYYVLRNNITLFYANNLGTTGKPPSASIAELTKTIDTQVRSLSHITRNERGIDLQVVDELLEVVDDLLNNMKKVESQVREIFLIVLGGDN